MSETVKLLEEALNQEVRMRNEIVAWRNRFPDYAFAPRECRIVLAPAAKVCNCHIGCGNNVAVNGCPVHGPQFAAEQ